ncbi:MAG: peptidylprolyl isomerase [Muribaculaceae bacterium]|nr:peptidylprolyl isomerase [Muribaculaceae bacterium]
MTEQSTDTASVKIAVKTSAGDITLLLYGDTPKHRDNFVRLVEESYYDSVLFHRVIKNFMIQTGDPESKTALAGTPLGAGGPGYTIDAEIVFPRHFHKRGALAAARQGDAVNPQKRSSGSQFYIVTGNKLTDGDVDNLAMHLLNNRKQSIFNRLAGERRQTIIDMQSRGDRAGLQALQEELIKLTEAEVEAEGKVTISEEMRQAYTTVGGAPHLDGEYTVFGEVIEGMDVVEAIENAATDKLDRPKEDIRIISMKVVK